MPEESNKAWQADLDKIYGIADASNPPPTSALTEPKTETIEPSISSVAVDEVEGDNGELACGMCGNPYLPKDLTVASSERFNFESAVVVCPICLENMRQELKKRTDGANLGMASLWGFVFFLIFSVIVGLLVWFNRSLTIETPFRFIGAYLAIFPGFAIGKAIFYGSGQKESLWQRLIAVGFVLLYLYLTYWVACSAFLNNQFDIIRPNGHDLLTVPLLDVLLIYVPQMFATSVLETQLWLPFAVLGSTLAALAAAYITSGGPRLYTRPFVK